MPEIRKYKVTIRRLWQGVPSPDIELALDAYDAADALMQAQVAAVCSIHHGNGRVEVMRSHVVKIEPVKPATPEGPESA